MKKILAVICVLFMLLFVSCDKKNKILDDKTSINNIENINSNTTVIGIEEKTVVSTKESLQTSKATVSSASSSSSEALEKVPPYILTESLKDLKLIKTAVNSMDETEFADYMKSNFNTESFNGMDSIENAKKYLSDFENAYIVYVDEFSEDNTMAYYTEYGDISYKIPVDNNFVMSVTYYVNSENSFEYKEMDYIRHLKTYEINGILIELFENTSNETEGFYGNIKYNNISIPFFTNIKINIEYFENVLTRIGIVQIGDLLNE